ncbi:unnamed protein product [Rotaria sp. Silwood1]|nr:unnamed protein product [Rotaria sp. Silwood1]
MAEPLGDKNIRNASGIGDVLGAQFFEADYEIAYTFFVLDFLKLMSSTTSQKFRDFTGEPLKDTHISEVPGLGPKLASNLEEPDIAKVCLQVTLIRWIR